MMFAVGELDACLSAGGGPKRDNSYSRTDIKLLVNQEKNQTNWIPRLWL